MLKIMKFMVFLFLCFGYTSGISVKSGRYEDLYIVIEDNNEESDILLERIQEIFTDASKLLFKATKNNLYFGNIKVIVPKSWQHKEKYKKALIPSNIEQKIIINNVGKYGLTRVFGMQACGKGGSYMYLNSKSFILETERTSWGLHDNVIVHEFGHLRYGLFDEYPVSRGNAQFYQYGGEWKPSRCTEELQGEIGMGIYCKKSPKCDYRNTAKKLDDNCNFCPNRIQNEGASLMGYQWIDALSMFCEKTDPATLKNLKHNHLAKTKHNERCGSKSAWEIMRKHPDFIDAYKLPNSTDTTPSFEFIKETEKYRVFVLDVSGSMGGERLDILLQVTTFVIKDLIPADSYLGIITFNNRGYVAHKLTEVTSVSVRRLLVNALPTVASGGTCIGCGIESAIELLDNELGDATNGELIVISDGKDNGASLNEARGKVLTENVIVHTISVTQEADAGLADISKDSGGKHFTYLETGSASFTNLFEEIIVSSQTSSASKQPLMLASESIRKTTSNIVSLAFPLENDLGKDTTFAILVQSDYNGRLQLNLSGPNNFSRTISTYEKTATLQIPNIAQAGIYEASVTLDTNGVSLEYVLKSTPLSGDFIKIEPYLSASKIDFETGELPIIFAEVTKGYSQVINANVTARVETNDGGKGCDIYLYDNGFDPDDISDDGIYSAYIFPNCLGAGRVNVKLFATGQEGKMRIKSSTPGSQDPFQEEQIEELKESFQRVKLMEDLYITNYVDPGLSDTVPPGKITDVDIHHIVTTASKSGESRNFTISWTAPGDDKNIGQASDYIFRISDDFEALLHDFDNAEVLDVGNFSLKPSTAGEKEALKIVVDAEKSYTSTVFFALKAVDEVGNTGEVSNILSIVVAKGYRAHGEAGDLKTVTIDIDTGENEKNETYIIILGLAAGLAVFLIIVVTACVYRNRRAAKTRYKDVPLGPV